MDIQNLVPVDYSNRRVLLTAQVAEVFNTTTERISHHFSENKQAFDEGEHFFKLTGAALRSFKKKWVSPPFSKMANCLFLWTELGTARHCQMLNDSNALAIMEQLRVAYFNQKPALSPQIVEIEGVRGYLDKDNIVWLNAADVARELGFTTFATSGENEERGNFATCGKKIYEGIRWERINRYLAEFEFPPVDKDTFIPESEFYLLAMKAKNEKAKKFQDKMAAELVRLKANARTNKPAMTPQVFDKVGYIDDKGTAWFNAEFVARGLGFTTVAKSGNAVVRWARVNEYLKEFGFSANVPKGVATSCNGNYQANCPEFLPENIVYRLAMKANNETAVQFQIKIANDILPSIRQHGFYSEKSPVETSLFPDEEPVKKIKRRPTPELAVVYAVLLSNLLVKIGYTRDLTARMKDLQKETKADILKWAASAVMTRDDAILLERALKVKFFDNLVAGELFNVDFDAAKAALTHDDKFDKLLALAEKVNSPDEKDKLLIRAANLI